jgi:hypothetical protein
MTRLEFLLSASAHVEQACPERFQGLRVAAGKLLLFAMRQGYGIDQLMSPLDIPAMMKSLDMVVFCTTNASYPHHAGSVRNPSEMAAHFLSVLRWLEKLEKGPQLRALLEAVIAPFAPVALCS